MGADLTAPHVVGNREALKAAWEDLRTAAAEQPDLTVTAISATLDAVWIGNPESASDLHTLVDLGSVSSCRKRRTRP